MSWLATKEREELKKIGREQAAREFAAREGELKRKASENAEMIHFLAPPKLAKNAYLEQKPAKYVFKCMDGDIQIPEYGILRTDFYYQAQIN